MQSPHFPINTIIQYLWKLPGPLLLRARLSMHRRSDALDMLPPEQQSQAAVAKPTHQTIISQFQFTMTATVRQTAVRATANAVEPRAKPTADRIVDLATWLKDPPLMQNQPTPGFLPMNRCGWKLSGMEQVAQIAELNDLSWQSCANTS